MHISYIFIYPPAPRMRGPQAARYALHLVSCVIFFLEYWMSYYILKCSAAFCILIYFDILMSVVNCFTVVSAPLGRVVSTHFPRYRSAGPFSILFKIFWKSTSWTGDPKTSKMTARAPKTIANSWKIEPRTIQTSVHQVSGAGGRGEAFRYSPHPLQGEHGVLNQLSESAESEASGSLNPCRRPLQKVSQKSPKIHLFSDLTKWEAQIERNCSQEWPRGSFLDVIFNDFSVFLLKMLL